MTIIPFVKRGLRIVWESSEFHSLGNSQAGSVEMEKDAPLLHQELDLLWTPPARRVADRPRCLLPDVELRGGTQLDQGGVDVVVHHGLALVLVARGDVGDGPTRLLVDAWGRRGGRGGRAERCC